MIYNFFKSKPFLKELIPEGFIDIHSHILPGIDDGAKNIGESLMLISNLEKLNFSKIICTPHTYKNVYDNTNITISDSFNLLIKELNSEIRVNYASEYMLDNHLLEMSENKTLLTLKENLVLVEMSYISEPINLFEIIFNLQINGYEPVLAHPERYIFLINSMSKLEKLKKIGVKFQLNLLSCTGYYGKKVMNFADKLLKLRYIDFVGTDIHNFSHINSIEKRKVQIREINELENVISMNSYFKD